VDAGGVHEADAVQVDHDRGRVSRRDDPERFLEQAGGGQVDLALDHDDDHVIA
jgi:hypothetical protein